MLKCFFAIAIVKQIRPGVSVYRIFAWTDGLIGLGVTGYAVYDIMTDTGWFAGLVGTLLLTSVIPAVLLLLAADYLLYKARG